MQNPSLLLPEADVPTFALPPDGPSNRKDLAVSTYRYHRSGNSPFSTEVLDEALAVWLDQDFRSPSVLGEQMPRSFATRS
jgi:hypothetical protein